MKQKKELKLRERTTGLVRSASRERCSKEVSIKAEEMKPSARGEMKAKEISIQVEELNFPSRGERKCKSHYPWVNDFSPERENDRLSSLVWIIFIINMRLHETDEWSVSPPHPPVLTESSVFCGITRA